MLNKKILQICLERSSFHVTRGLPVLDIATRHNKYSLTGLTLNPFDTVNCLGSNLVEAFLSLDEFDDVLVSVEDEPVEPELVLLCGPLFCDIAFDACLVCCTVSVSMYWP